MTIIAKLDKPQPAFKLAKMKPIEKLGNGNLQEGIGLMTDGMCLWEAMLGWHFDTDDETLLAKADPHIKAMNEMWDNVGTAEMRYLCAGLVPDCNEAWRLLGDELCDTMQFDWDYCPRFLRHVDWQGPMDSDPERIAAEFKAAFALGVYE